LLIDWIQLIVNRLDTINCQAIGHTYCQAIGHTYCQAIGHTYCQAIGHNSLLRDNSLFVKTKLGKYCDV